MCFNYQGIYPGDDDDEIEDHEDDEKPKDSIYKKCLCGGKNCKGNTSSLDLPLKLTQLRYYVQIVMVVLFVLYMSINAFKQKVYAEEKTSNKLNI